MILVSEWATSAGALDPYTLTVYDRNGVALIANSESNDSVVGFDSIYEFVSPESGTYYINPSWNQSSSSKAVSLTVYEDVDTIPVPPVVPVYNSIAVAGNYAYITDMNKGLKIIDISNPSSPVVKGTLDTPGYAQDIAVAGNYAYVADSYNGLNIIDISNPNTPALKGIYDTSGVAEVAWGVTIVGN